MYYTAINENLLRKKFVKKRVSNSLKAVMRSTIFFQDDQSESFSSLNWEQLLGAENPHKLVYSLQIIESLSRSRSSCHRHFLNVSLL